MNKQVLKSGQTIGIGLLVGTLFLFLLCILAFVSNGGRFNPAELHISDMADFPGEAGIVYRIGMTMLVPFRLLFLLYVLHVFKILGIGKSARMSILIFALISYLGLLTMSCYSPADDPDIHVKAALVYFFSALFTMCIITLFEYRKNERLGYIIPLSSSLIVLAHLLFLATILMTLVYPRLPRPVSILSEWFILLTQMGWLYVHSVKINQKLTSSTKVNIQYS